MFAPEREVSTPVQYALLSVGLATDDLTEIEQCLKTNQLALRFHERLQGSGAQQPRFAIGPPAHVERVQQRL